MKPLFFRKKSLWYCVIITGILFVGIGLFQMSMSLSKPKSGTEGVPLSPVAGSEKSMKKTPKVIGEARQNDFFIEYRLERDRTRSQQVDWLREIVNNQNSQEESRKEAQQRLLAITKTIETEMKLESLLKAESFKDAVVVTDENSVTIIVQVPMLTEADKNKITEITSRITGFDQQHIKIIRKV